MKVALELQPCLGEKSGIGIYTYELAKCLQENKDIELIGNIFYMGKREGVRNQIDALKFNTSICPLMPYGVYKRLWKQLPISYHRFFTKRTELMHFFNVIIPPRIEGKVINTIHDLTFCLYPETIDQKHLKFLHSNMKQSVERPDKIITISENSRHEIIKHLHVDPNKIEIVYPGVDPLLYQHVLNIKEIEQVRERYKLPQNYILYMGTLEPRKNIERIVEAFSLFKQNSGPIGKDFKLVLAGKKGWLYDTIFEKVKYFSLEQEIIFTDYVEEGHKVILYRLASLFIFPSLYEGFGIPVLEAMAGGVPVITSNCSSLPEVAGTAAVLVDPYDSESMAIAMERILSDEEMRQALIREGYQQIKKFNWGRSAQKLYQVYQEVLGEIK